MTVEEMKIFLGLTFITGIIKKPKLKCVGQIILFLAHQYFHNNAFLHSSDSLHQAHACDMLSRIFPNVCTIATPGCGQMDAGMGRAVTIPGV
jgi:hypothetical protein